MENSIKIPKIIEGGSAIDERGQIVFCNDFNFNNIKRFYVLENFSINTVRAFHGHLEEEKYVLVLSGAAIVAAVEMDDVKKPNKKNKVHRFILSANKPNILHIPIKYANGFKALKTGTKIIFFSTSSLKNSGKDDYRFPYDYWGKDICKIKNH